MLPKKPSHGIEEAEIARSLQEALPQEAAVVVPLFGSETFPGNACRNGSRAGSWATT